VAQIETNSNAPRAKEQIMDMTKYMGSPFLKPEDVEEGPRHVRIAKIEDGRYDKPVVTFDDNSRLSLNVTNSRVLGRAYGTDSRDWIGMEVEWYLGEIEYNKEPKASVLIRPLTSPAAARTPAKPQLDRDMDDEIPFFTLRMREAGRHPPFVCCDFGSLAMATYHDLSSLAKALGGEVSAGQILAPGPGHSADDRSLSIKLDSAAPQGFLVHSFAGDDPARCRAHVREKLGLPDLQPKKSGNGKAWSPVRASYIYRDRNGAPYLRVQRTATKQFFQQHWDGANWIKGKPQGPKVPYRLPELLAAAPTTPVYICEGEKDADNLMKLGFLATCNSGGADPGNGSKWTAELNAYFKDRHVYILPDNDAPRLMPDTPQFFNQTAVPFDYDPNAPEPAHWRGFLDMLWPTEPAAIDVLGEWFGYVISGRLDLHKILLMVGPTRGGKGVIARILTALIGRANAAGPTLNSLGGEFGLAPLIGKSLAIISDARFVGKNGPVVVERLLSISGEDTLTVNRKYRDMYR
jgi:Family of unknown function (DUF5906)